MTKRKALLYSIVTGLVLSAAWPPYGAPFLLFIAFIPLLYVEHYAGAEGSEIRSPFLFTVSYLGFFVFNFISGWWVGMASFGGGAMAVLANSLLMSITFYIYHLIRKRLAPSPSGRAGWGGFLLIPIWITFEFLHHDWDLTYPWFTFGNALSGVYKWIQWYEYTGVFGGSFWVLLINVLLFQLSLAGQDLNPDQLKQLFKQKKFILKIAFVLDVIMIPMLISYFIYTNYEEKKDPVNIVVVQPNVDPYNQKFTVPFQEQLNQMLSLAEDKIDSTTDYVVFPETALTENLWEDSWENTASMQILKSFSERHPQIKIITGASTAYEYQPNEEHSPTAKKFRDADTYYEDYNTAIQLDTSGIQKYHKSKFVPGVEKMPFPLLFKPIEKLAIDLGGTAGSLCGQEERTVFVGKPPLSRGRGAGGEARIAPVICYESIYGEFTTGYIKNGADAIFIITNDGWWGDTPGYKQHLLYGRLRTIENRRSLARSANTGISCFINQRGDISQQTDWWVPAVIKGSINLNSEKTFYTRFGDYIGRACLYISALLAVWALFVKFKPVNGSSNE